MIEVMQETTDWGDYKVNNGIYHMENDKLIAYQPNLEADLLVLKKPSTGFDKRGRTFVKIDQYEGDSTPAFNIITVKGSKGNEYQIDTDKQTCTCPGYTFRGNCKHVKELQAA